MSCVNGQFCWVENGSQIHFLQRSDLVPQDDMQVLCQHDYTLTKPSSDIHSREVTSITVSKRNFLKIRTSLVMHVIRFNNH